MRLQRGEQPGFFSAIIELYYLEIALVMNTQVSHISSMVMGQNDVTGDFIASPDERLGLDALPGQLVHGLHFLHLAGACQATWIDAADSSICVATNSGASLDAPNLAHGSWRILISDPWLLIG